MIFDALNLPRCATKMTGYASSVGALHPNVLAIAAPIQDATGALAGAVSITTLEPSAQNDEQKLAKHVIAAAQKISEKVGFSAPA